MISIISKLSVLFTMLFLGIAPLAIIAQSPPPEIDPNLYYVDGGIVRLSSADANGEVTSAAVSGISTEAFEAGSHFYPHGHRTHYRNPSAVNENACGGGDDDWVYFHHIPEFEFSTNDLRIGSWHRANDVCIKLRHGGLHGGFICEGALCNISVCSPGNLKPWRLKLSWN
ncbi:MAG: hypothetical protein OXG49_15940 [Chloroflexi bacterium]|nr:hypothetical protein [Chloroflexota bacterium]